MLRLLPLNSRVGEYAGTHKELPRSHEFYGFGALSFFPNGYLI